MQRHNDRVIREESWLDPDRYLPDDPDDEDDPDVTEKQPLSPEYLARYLDMLELTGLSRLLIPGRHFGRDMKPGDYHARLEQPQADDEEPAHRIWRVLLTLAAGDTDERRAALDKVTRDAGEILERLPRQKLYVTGASARIETLDDRVTAVVSIQETMPPIPVNSGQ